MTDLLETPPAPTGNGHRPSVAPVPGSRRGLRALLHEYRPSIITGGASASPLLVLAAINAADEFDRVAFGVLLPEIRDYFGVSLTTVLTVTAIAGIMPLLFAVPVGFLADRHKRTRLTAIGVATFGLFSVLTGMVPSLLLLAAARFGSGMGKTLDPAPTSLLADYYPPDRRAGVYAVHRFGNELGLLLAPAFAGILASIFFWQVPFLLFGIPAAVLAILVLRLKEPVRGGQERRLMGADEATVDTEEAPPGWTEAWRIAKGVRTLRRIWAALPFLVGSYLGTVALLSVYFDEEFGVGEAGRGLITSAVQIFAVAGLLIGGAVGNRVMAKRPSHVVTYAGLVALLPALAFAGVAFAPWLWLAVAFNCVAALAIPFFGPTSTALISRVIPPRVRSFALAVGVLFIAPGVAIAPLAGALADAYGIRTGVFLLAPVFAIGALIIVSAGQTVDSDIRAATAAAMAGFESRRSKQQGRTKLLVCRDVDVRYGQVQVLFGVDLEIEEGEIVALLGTNGAGKSTLLGAIGGTTTASNGAIFFDGEDITYLPTSDHVPKGIVQVPGGKGVFPTLTVGENLKLASWLERGDAKATAAAIEEIFEFFPRLRERQHEAAGNLSGGEQQMLTLGQAFLSKPKLLMIDELSLGLAPAIVEQLLGIVRAIHASGTTIVLVEQSVNIALTVAERAVFMEKGEVKFTGPTSELLQRTDILRSVFLAGSASAGGSFGRRSQAQLRGGEPETVLALAGLTKRFGGVQAVNGVDLVLKEGEILGLIGPNGAGKTSLFDLISGFTTPDEGRIHLLGDDVTFTNADERAKLGLHRSFQDARLFPALSVEENLLVALDRHLAVRSGAMAGLRLPKVRNAEAKLRKRAERLILLLNLQPFRDKFLRELSTGTRRLVDLACVLATDPAVLLLDEPSSGVAQKETEELGPLLQRIKFEAGCSILIIEHDMPLISSVADELIALELGAVVTRGRAEEVLHHPQVVRSYLGTDEDVIARSGSRAAT